MLPVRRPEADVFTRNAFLTQATCLNTAEPGIIGGGRPEGMQRC